MEKQEWIYKSTAKKTFKLTDNQINQAIALGLLASKNVENPNYRHGPPATLLKLSDLTKNLEQIRSLPKLAGHEKAKRKVYAERKRLRDKLEFYCPRCKKKIRALKDSTVFETCFKGDVSLNEAKKRLMIAHYRHLHTSYEGELSMLNEERYERYRALRRRGYDFDTAWEIANEESDEEIEDLKKQFNAEAIKLLKEDKLLP